MTARQLCRRHPTQTGRTAMKTLVGVAVFGLVPVPPMPDTVASGFDGRWTTNGHDLDLSQLVFFPHPFAERMATKHELARIRCELEEIAAKTSTKGPRHSRAGAPAASTLQRAAARRSILGGGSKERPFRRAWGGDPTLLLKASPTPTPCWLNARAARSRTSWRSARTRPIAPASAAGG